MSARALRAGYGGSYAGPLSVVCPETEKPCVVVSCVRIGGWQACRKQHWTRDEDWVNRPKRKKRVKPS